MIIQTISIKFRKPAGWILFFSLYMGMVIPILGVAGTRPDIHSSSYNGNYLKFYEHAVKKNELKDAPIANMQTSNLLSAIKVTERSVVRSSPNIGGPNQPEMSSFKPVSADNLVNLFTGDFSYNIPLMDVGGYPVNIFYDGGIGMEQEASWVGLGWNINPGNVTRNMRGVPDDFDGREMLKQTQVMKPNKTWGITLGADAEAIGIKDFLNVDLSLGVSFNNYLGPALDLGVKGGANFTISKKATPEKSGDTTFSSLGIKVGVSANLSSRNGLTLSPSVSLASQSFLRNVKVKNQGQGSFGLSTSYNSRVGIRSLQITEQASFDKFESKKLASGKEELNGDNFRMPGLSTSISFNKPSYTPAVRMPLTNSALSGHFQLGLSLFGLEGSVDAEVYKQVSEVEPEDQVQQKPMIGFLHAQLGQNNSNAIMDFSRLNDQEVITQTPIISAPQYAYDVFSIQGEGTGGSIRAYRNDLFYMRDNLNQSKDKSFDLGFDLGAPGQIGANANIVKTPTTIGDWNDGNLLRPAFAQINSQNSTLRNETVYFRNPGETSVLSDQEYASIGGIDLVRFKLGQSKSNPTVEPTLEKFDRYAKSNGLVHLNTVTYENKRKKRTQVTSFLTAAEASEVGIEKSIRNYNPGQPLNSLNHLQYDEIARVGGFRNPNHISQITVTEPSGMRYVYGVPVYNIEQSDFSFSVDNPSLPSDPDRVIYSPDKASANSPLLSSGNVDGYVQITETPAFAHSFLISALLSPDYVDVDDNGVTENDLGNAVKFNYTKFADAKWRTPLSGTTSAPIANFNVGKMTDSKDDKAMISYGVRESWYMHSIESKTMIALFTLENRDDAKGALSVHAGINTSDQSRKLLRKIDLYNKSDIKKNGIGAGKAKPIKTVHFEYDYSLCQGTPDNSTGQGKLTLKKIYFSFNGQQRANKNQYLFSYDDGQPGNNPSYIFNANDRWGTFKPKEDNPPASQQLWNSEYPYSVQDKTVADKNAAPWALRKILLPSGGQIEVNYESDDYAFVQNKRACNMMRIAGFGSMSNPPSPVNRLYDVLPRTIVENDYLFVTVPETFPVSPTVSDIDAMYKKYLEGLKQADGSISIALKMAVHMPKNNSVELLPCYATLDQYGIYNSNTIWLKLKMINDDISPLSLTAIEFLRESLPGQAFPGYDVSESSGLSQIGDMLAGWLDGLKSAFKNPVKHLREGGKAQIVDLSRSFVRLCNPDGVKLGGGYRVKSVKLKDNWKTMTNQFTSEYGQEYNYATTEVFNGSVRTISSGVASYEPSLGGEENPFHSIVQISSKLPLGPASYGAIEMPVLDAFFPSPLVGYSKVTVKSIRKGTFNPATHKIRSGIGKQVTTYYTAKDFPVMYQHTPIEPTSDKIASSKSFSAFFYKYTFDSRAISQGFIVETNDMHGKMKSQASYPENDPTTAISYTENFYRNTGVKGFEDKFQFVYADEGGVIKEGNMGIDAELMIDVREFSVKSKGFEIQAQVDLFPVVLPIWLPFIWPVVSQSENTYRAVTTTKLINYHSIVDSVVVIDKGSLVSTKNILFDSETGEVVVNRTNNEYKQPVYQTSYPAYWAYSGMGLAYKNIDVEFSNVDFYDGRIISPGNFQNILESGDEIYVMNPAQSKVNPCRNTLSPFIHSKLWAFNKNKNTSSLTDMSPDFVFLDRYGKLYTRSGVKIRVIRSGKRNLLGEKVQTITSLSNPMLLLNGIYKLKIDQSSKVIRADVKEFKEKWQIDNDLINKFNYVWNSCAGEYNGIPDCNGELDKAINPYQKGLLGNFRSYRAKAFYGNRVETDPSLNTNLPANGLISNFTNYWDFSSNNNLIPDDVNTKWVWVNEITKVNAKGLEIETKNALGIYTAANYGYNKTLPVSIVSNSRSYQSVGLGFEDGNYNEHLNPSITNICPQVPLNLNGIISTSNALNLNAHTGLGSFIVPPSSTSQISIPIGVANTESYNMVFQEEIIPVLANPGGVVNNIVTYPLLGSGSPLVFTTNPYSNNLGFGNHAYGNYAPNTGTQGGFSFSYDATFYVEFLQDNLRNLHFEWNAATTVNENGAVTNNNVDFSYEIFDLQNNLVYSSVNATCSSTVASPGYASGFCNGSVFLCEGKYKVVVYSQGYQSGGVSDYSQVPVSISGQSSFFFTCTNTPGPGYSSLATQNGCVFTKPIPAVSDMLNPEFSLIQGEKMHFSTWVREYCGNIITGEPCTALTYQNNKIILEFDNGATAPIVLNPAGPIIEGWQRYDADFNVPVTATNMILKFENTTNGSVHFDDLRIHPFNANMKNYVYDPVSLRLIAELDENNYATFYEYDEEGTLVRTKKETVEGVKTIMESRSAKQKNINSIQ